MKTDEGKIFKAAKSFRDAIEKTEFNSINELFVRFPAGCCGDTSLLLGAYLYEIGLGNFEYVCGISGKQSHAWLERNGLIVDITSDQFLDGTKVYVGGHNSFYNRFKENFRHLWNITLEGNTIKTDRLYYSYLTIKNAIQNNL